MQISKNTRFIVILLLIILLIGFTYIVLENHITMNRENTVIDTTKLGTINDSILFHKNVIVIYKDSMTNEIQRIDSISNDSAIKLFRELINE